MYGLPCCVMAAASPPVKLGISARLHGERLRHLRLRLGVVRRVFDRASEDAARGIDFLHRELHAVVEVAARRGAGTRQLDQSEDLDGLGLCEQRVRQCQAEQEGANMGDGAHRTG